ncbi:MAG: vanadium-dependent haloperoxidase [Solirubrobacteraceae bacterium]
MTVDTTPSLHPTIVQLNLGMMSAAVYDAVVAIEGGYAPYGGRLDVHGRGHASPQAAAATAAYRILTTNFPQFAAKLAADYQSSLALIPDGRAKDNGIAIGEASAARIVFLRQGDGRSDPSIAYTRAPDTGVWRPTPPALAPFAVVWMGFVRPLVLSSQTQFPLHGPDALTSRRYARDFKEVHDFGSATGSMRTPDQTENALFWTDNTPVQYQEGVQDLVKRHGLDIVRSARTFAVLNAAGADAAISCWRAKYDFAFWRPITAIALAGTDGNPDTTADAAWKPLIDTPPYPDYPSGHACLSGSYAGGLSALFGARHIDLNVSSAVTKTVRHYETERQLNEDTMNARIWLGIHFRRAMTDGNQLGHDVAAFVLGHAFQPTRGRDRHHGW